MTGPVVVRASAAPLVEWRPGVRSRLHAAPASPPSALCVLEQWCDPGCGAPTHTHFETEELIAVIAGSAEVWVDGGRTLLEAGGSVLLPPQSWHGFRNDGDGELHVLAVFAAARPLVQYRDEHEQAVLEVGGAGEAKVDPHRAVHES